MLKALTTFVLLPTIIYFGAVKKFETPKVEEASRFLSKYYTELRT